ncbi:hypothetical protein [Streptomyces triticiradicis]|uniref:Lipoprotein n=1 Tax=Streptomyces triticiradicis TaxID=2651189 RepID=A0A7J5DJH1_9ACTN|nr:hypothetical protein [Streptomyces triticiradicis]KAB1988848.1 hypothetical protein F8144_09855 [Streptomyces triticiradicis]
MFSGKKIAAVLGLVGGLAATCTGVSWAAHDGGSQGSCVRDSEGSVSCTQHIEGRVPSGTLPPHQETCLPVQRLTVPSVQGNGTMQIGPQVTCSPAK